MEQRNNLVLHGTETFSRGALDLSLIHISEPTRH